MINSRLATVTFLAVLAVSLISQPMLNAQTNLLSLYNYKVKTPVKDVYIDKDGYVYVLTQQNFGGTNKTDIILIKLDQTGHTVWSRQYKDKLNQYANTFTKTVDGGFLICGTEANSLYLIKTYANGTLTWSHKFTKNLYNIDPKDVVQVGTDYFVVGSLYNSTVSYLYVMKFDESGKKLIDRTFEDTGAGNKIISTSDGNVLFASNDTLVKMSLDGKTIWRRSIDDYDVNFDVYGLAEMANGYVFIGQFDNIVNNVTLSRYIGMLMTDSDGNETWGRVYGYPYALVRPGVQVLATTEGGYIITGYDSGYCLIKFTQFGEKEWLQYTEDGTDVLSVNQSNGGNYLVVTGTEIATYAADYPSLELVSAYGSTSGQGIYTRGYDVRFSVSPETVEVFNGVRAVFQGWVSNSSGGYTGSLNPVVITLNNPITEKAVWKTQYYVDVKSANGATNVSSGWYDDGSVISFEATPNPGYKFKEWTPITINNSTFVQGNTLQLTVTAPVTVEPIFVKDVRELSVLSEYGSTSGTGEYTTGSNVTFEVTPSTVVAGDTRYIFAGWTSSNGGYIGFNNPATITLNNNITETATWRTEYYVNVSSTKGGEVSPSSGWFKDGANVTFEASADSGYTFLVWSVNDVSNTSDILKLIVDRPFVIEASFGKQNMIPSFSMGPIALGLILVSVLIYMLRKRKIFDQ